MTERTPTLPTAPPSTPAVRPLWIARLAGSQEAMGRQHGRLAAGAAGAAAVADHYPDMPERVLVGERGPAAAMARLAVRAGKELALARLVADRPADLRARSRAFMVALGRPADHARFGCVMDVVQNAVGLASRLGTGPFAAARGLALGAAQPACSTVMVWGAASADGALRHARNFDFPGVGVWDAAPALVLCTPDDGQRYGFVTCRGADVPVVTVFNEAGLTITTHTRFHRAVGWGGAVIVDLVHDLVRRARSIDDAIRIARSRRSASTWGLAVSSAREGRAVVLEIHADRVEVVEARPGADHLTCANRYRHPAMQDGEAAASTAWALHSDARELRLAQLVAAARAGGGADTAALAAMLADREDAAAPGVVRHLGGVVASPCTVHSIVVDVAARRLALGVAPAPACQGAWLEATWSWDGAVGSWETPLDVAGEVGGVAVRPLASVPRSAAASAAAAAVRHEQWDHDDDAIAAALDRGIAAAPGDPSLRLGAAWIALRRLDHGTAVDHVRAGLALERLPYRRGQLLLWGARAAAARGEAAQAATWRDELDRLGGEVADLQAAARLDRAGAARAWRRRRPTVNLGMMDAQ